MYKYINIPVHYANLLPGIGCLDGPSQVRIARVSGDESPLEQGEILNCTSTGNPSPEFTWFDTTTGGRLHVGQQLTFDVCRHFDCNSHSHQPCGRGAPKNETVTLRCVATVVGHEWNRSDNTTVSFLIDQHLFNSTAVCGTNALCYQLPTFWAVVTTTIRLRFDGRSAR